MESKVKNKRILKHKRTLRVRKNLRGSESKPRLCVVKSNKHIRVQVIDDENHKTLASTSTLSKEFKGTENARKSCSAAKHLGLVIANLAKKQNVEKVVFDRGSFKYHGVIASVADGAREGGLKF
jgi:large subunit ribosomal protein L18